ncbi:dihydropteroate synthase [Candidatus Kirkpatrickella diaphorinae]|uniref:Dihydropteroate synthase n=1 Tax=Candidatus Kirkpatrickella diaphorinae TaxID=2984322 RepID=A0ABY6GIC5_9PROT|nr:dihydropteroate synthase [Candidatus Kirkpatrickella diaphorinae]UYH51259.1 dihydropteroate synthase [Candidatus Kirkpatrickella diaphorinae]
MASDLPMPRPFPHEPPGLKHDMVLAQASTREALGRQIARAHRGASAPLIMGILNATPDSFSDGGVYVQEASAAQRAMTLAQEGAAIIDIGGESTRPDSSPVPLETERARISAILEASVKTGCAVSCDTYKPDIARYAVKAGAVMINDVGGTAIDPAMVAVAAETGAFLVIMHGLRETAEGDVTDALSIFFEKAINRARSAGVASERIILDPGIGFNKSDAQNIGCFDALPTLRQRFDVPLLVGISRKSMLGRLTGRDVQGRLPASLAAATIAARQGAAIIRVHDVAPHVDAMRVTHALSAVTSGRRG